MQQQQNRTAIQLMGIIMSKQTLDVNSVLDLVEALNNSNPSCRDLITILEDIFKHEKSNKILIAVNALEYLVKNCSRNFHNAANRQSFQKRLLGLLNRLRGKTNILKQMSSNLQNWCRIQAKVLYIIQLWYDAFILEQSKYSNIINTYKVLRKQNVTFPPRSKNQKNLMLVDTESPIFDNIEQIAHDDQKKFNKKLNAMGMSHLKDKMESNINKLSYEGTGRETPSFNPYENHNNNQKLIQQQRQLQAKFRQNRNRTPQHSSSNNNNGKIVRQVNIDDISQKIAIIQSTQQSTSQTLKTIEQLKKDIQFGKVKPNEEAYWKEIKIAAQQLVQEWEMKNSELIQNQEKMYLERKLGKMGVKKESNNSQVQVDNFSRMNTEMKPEQQKKQQHYNQEPKNNSNNEDIFDLLGDFQEQQHHKQQTSPEKQSQKQGDLLDLL